MTRAAHPQLTFADLEFLRQGIDMDENLKKISEFLDTQPEVVERVRQDLQRGLKNPHTGRKGLTPEQTLRSYVLRRVKDWDYRELRERIADGLSLRRFTRFYGSPVPKKHKAFNDAFNKLRPPTVKAINDLVVRGAVALGLEDGSKLRVDTTVSETDIHHPTDNTLLWDVVRVVTRLVGRLGELLPKGIPGFTDRTRSARRRMQEIQRMAAKERHDQQEEKYRELIHTTEQVVGNAPGAQKDERCSRRRRDGRHCHSRAAQDDRALQSARGPRHRSNPPPSAQGRAGPGQREDLFDL